MKKTQNEMSRRRFLTSGLAATGAAVAISHSLSVCGQTVSLSSAPTQGDLKKAAQRTYQELKSVFTKSQNNWRLGHTFDTVVDYFVVTRMNDGEAAAFGQLALEKYAATRSVWYDDYAWWVLANLKASQHPQVFEKDADRFYNNCIQGWQKVSLGAQVWEQMRTLPKFQKLKPAVDGGVWNCDPSDDAGNDAFTRANGPLNPNGCAAAGCQNTVTNGLYLVSAARLARRAAQADSPYRADMDREYHFLQSWFDMSRPGFEPLLNVYCPGKAVVRERVSCYDSGEKVLGFRSDVSWAGDQGLILGGLAERMEFVKRKDPSYPAMLSAARQILAGVREYLTVDGLLLPWWPDPAINGSPEDYRTGIAVFMRYLLNVFQLNNEDLKGDLSAYTDFIASNVKHVLEHPSLTDGSADSTMVALTNDLAILTAAIGTSPS